MMQQTESSAIYANVLCTKEETQYQNISAILPDYSSSQAGCSPPPPYEEICTNSVQDCDDKCDEGSENLYDIIPADRASSTDDGQEFSAPDIFMEHKKKIKEPFQAVVNGKIVDYIVMPVLTRVEGKKRLIQYTEKLPKFYSKMAKECRVYSSEYKAVFRYKLQSLKEQRSFIEKTKPYTGEKLEPYCIHPVWNYKIDAPMSFLKCERYHRIPNVEKIASCKSCKGGGKGKCVACNGRGRITCNRCHGSGQESLSNVSCLQCNGGFEICYECRGSRDAKCKDCEGRGKVITYQRLKATWIVKEDQYIDEIHGIPNKLLTGALGHQIYAEQNDGFLNPIEKGQLLHPQIITVSEKFVARYKECHGAIIRKQRQTVDIILVQQFNCRYKTKEFSFYLVGMKEAFYSTQLSCMLI